MPKKLSNRERSAAELASESGFCSRPRLPSQPRVDAKPLPRPVSSTVRVPAVKRIRIFKTAELAGVELRQFQGCRRLWTTVHGSYDFCCMMGSSAPIGWLWGRKRFTLGPQSVAMVQPGDVHRVGKLERPATLAVLLVAPEFLTATLGQEGVGLPTLTVGQVDSERAARQFRSLAYRMMNGEPVAQLESELFDFLDCQVVPQFTGTKSPSTRCETAVQLLRDVLCDSFRQNVSLDECARLTGMSKFHLHRCFTKHFGVPPYTYLTDYRLQQARELLHRGYRPVELAEATGFANHSHLSRAFQRGIGMSPTEYARLFE